MDGRARVLAGLSAQQKAADVAVLVIRGAELTTAQVAERYEMSWQGADEMMSRISGVLPILKDGRGVWLRLSNLQTGG